MTVLGLNLGSYYGDGTGSLIAGYSGSGTSGYSARTRNATSSNIKSMSRNTSAGYEHQMKKVEKFIKAGEIDKALSVYQDLFDDIKVSNSYGNIVVDDCQVASIMSNAYESASGYDILDALEKKTSGSFWSGVLQGIPLIGLLCEDTTRAEAYAKLDNQKVETKDKVKEYGGSIISGAATGAAIGTVLGGGVFSWATAGIGAAVGAGVGALQTFLKDIL